MSRINFVHILSFVVVLSPSARADSLTRIPAPSPEESDAISWSQFGPDGTFFTTANLTVSSAWGWQDQALIGTGENLISRVCPSSSPCGWTGRGFTPGDSLLWKSKPGTGPVQLRFPSGIGAVGAFAQPDVPGPFTAQIEAFNGQNSLGLISVPSEGDAVYVGVKDNTGPNITSVVFSISQCTGDCDDFAIGTVSIDPGAIHATVSTSSLNFGLQGIRQSDNAQSVTVSNGGSEPFPLFISTVGNFEQSNSCGRSLGGGQTCVIKVTFNPVNLGPASGSLTIGPTLATVSLSGTAVDYPTGPIAHGDTMNAGEVLYPGQSLTSANGRYTLTLQSDGNLVLYPPDGKSMWASNTRNKAVAVFILQADGNAVLYQSGWQSDWSSGKVGFPGSRLVVQNDGNVVTYNAANNPTWATNTLTPSGPVAEGSTMNPGEVLYPENSIKSPNGRYTLILQTDGNLVLSGPGGTLGLSKTTNDNIQVCIMQTDGNFVCYEPGPVWKFSSNTSGHPGSHLAVQDDGNVVIYSPTGPSLWSTKTAQP